MRTPLIDEKVGVVVGAPEGTSCSISSIRRESEKERNVITTIKRNISVVICYTDIKYWLIKSIIEETVKLYK